MCIGIPMQVVQSEPGWALVRDREQLRRIKTTLVGPCDSGQWLLVFLDDARELISAQRATEVLATLDLLFAAMSADAPTAATNEAAFSLPSAMSLQELQRLTQAPYLAGQTAATRSEPALSSTDQQLKGLS